MSGEVSVAALIFVGPMLPAVCLSYLDSVIGLYSSYMLEHVLVRAIGTYSLSGGLRLARESPPLTRLTLYDRRACQVSETE